MLTERQKKEIYESYLEDILYEWGTIKGAQSFEEFCKEWDEYGWEFWG